MAFVALYFADSRAATRGWAPHWYGTYRFLLTAMVGLAIFLSLVGRANIKRGETLSSQGLSNRMRGTGLADHKTNWAKLEQEEKERLRKEEEKKKKEAKEANEANEAEQKKRAEEKGGKKSGKGDKKAKASDQDSEKDSSSAP
ncbi:hypothetical protein HZ326_31174 [Fusarium oxysporum f. sp. albedinis]|nr:hypothetical protein HZ326_31174 [Fusarium oxysporum f. sp. albedinis]